MDTEQSLYWTDVVEAADAIEGLRLRKSDSMIRKVARKLGLKDSSSLKNDLAYWLSKAPEERVAAVEYLRRQYHGSAARLQRSARVIQRASS